MNGKIIAFIGFLSMLVTLGAQTNYNGVQYCNWYKDICNILDTTSQSQQSKFIIVMPCVSFTSMGSFKQGCDIMNHLSLNHNVVAVSAILDERGNLNKIVNDPMYVNEKDTTVFSFFLPSVSLDSYHHWLDNQRMRKSIKRLMRNRPDIILYNLRLGGGGHSVLSGIRDFLYIKNNHLYIFRTSSNISYELNDYANRLLLKTGDLTAWEDVSDKE